MHITLGIGGVMTLALAVIFWLVCHIIIRKRLNLE
jgi:hypothetical protein